MNAKLWCPLISVHSSLCPFSCPTSLAVVSRAKYLTRSRCNVSCIVGVAFAVLQSALIIRIFFTMAKQPPFGQGLLIVEASRSHSDTAQSVGLLWTSDQLITKNATWQHATLTTDIHAPAGFEPAFPASERPLTHALDLAAAGTGVMRVTHRKFKLKSVIFVRGTKWLYLVRANCSLYPLRPVLQAPPFRCGFLDRIDRKCLVNSLHPRTANHFTCCRTVR